MPHFTTQEYADMHFVYGECNVSARTTIHHYQKRFPDCIVPNWNTFIEVDQQLQETGSVIPNWSEIGHADEQ